MAASPRLPASLLEQELGIRTNESSASELLTQTTGTAAPPKASAAPQPASKNVFTGLCEALNTFQQSLVPKTYKIADQYVIEFAPDTLKSSQIKKQLSTDYKATPMQQGDTPKEKIDPATNSVIVQGRTVSVTAGTQIVQFIEQVMRGSTYITDQLLYQIDEVTGQAKKNNNSTDGFSAWYKISVRCESLGFDDLRNDFAYKMTFIVSPFGINEMRSQYLPRANFRGIHKAYDYWFTGKNTQILNYEQTLNNLYTLTVSDDLPLQRMFESDPEYLYRRAWATASSESSQQAKNKTNEPVANAAEWVYNQADFVNIQLQVVGDPAWIVQGENSGGISARTFDFNPFLTDGTVNADASEVTFSVTFNNPQDYDFNTGLTEVNDNKQKPDGTFGRVAPRTSTAYRAISCTSTFRQGRFTQDLIGQLIADVPSPTNPFYQKPNPDNGRPTGSEANQDQPQYGNNRSSNTLPPEEGDWQDVNGLNISREDIVSSTQNSGDSDSDPEPLPMSPPANPTSSGDIVPVSNSGAPQSQRISGAVIGINQELAQLQIQLEQINNNLIGAQTTNNPESIAVIAELTRQRAIVIGQINGLEQQRRSANQSVAVNTSPQIFDRET